MHIHLKTLAVPAADEARCSTSEEASVETSLERASFTSGQAHRSQPQEATEPLVGSELPVQDQTKTQSLWFMPLRFASNIVALACDPNFRSEQLERYLTLRIDRALATARISLIDSEQLRSQISDLRSSPYWSGLAMHLALVPLGYIINLALVGSLVAAGTLDAGGALLCSTMIGPSLRTLSTVPFFLNPAMPTPPFTALAAGLLPQVGQLAFAIQLSVLRESPGDLSRFLVRDSLGRLLPDRVKAARTLPPP